MPTFSILIPTYNRAALLECALASVFAQTFIDYEIIVIDDGSSDDTLLRLEPYLSERLRVLSQSRQGPGAARNLGSSAARGDYLVFLDSDDLLFPWSLESYARLIGEHGKPALLLARALKFEDEDELDAVSAERLEAILWDDYLSAAKARYPVGISAAVRADAFRLVGGFFSEHHCAEDQDLFLRLGEAEGFVFVASPYLYAYRQHGVSISGDAERSFQGALYMLEQERSGAYGGRKRAAERSILLARKLRYSLSRCLSSGQEAQALELYRRGWPLLVRAGYSRDALRFALTLWRRDRLKKGSLAPIGVRRSV